MPINYGGNDVLEKLVPKKVWRFVSKEIQHGNPIIGIDDTDSPDGMCTTYLASQIINKFEDNGIELVEYPRLIRLNPFARFKTRGNGGVSLKILNDDKSNLAREIVLSEVEKLSMFDCDNTNPGVIFYEGEITKKMQEYAFRAIYEFITIEEAEEFGKSVGCEIHKFKKGRGIIGSIAAISLPLSDYIELFGGLSDTH